MKFLPKESDRVFKWMIASVALSLLAGFDTSIGHAYGVGRTFYFIPYFIMGALWADIGKTIKPSKKKQIVCAVLAVAAVYALWKLGMQNGLIGVFSPVTIIRSFISWT